MPAGAGQPVCLLTTDDKPKVLKADKGLRTVAQQHKNQGDSMLR